MTAKLEADMLKISSGEKTLKGVVEESQDMLHKAASTLESEKKAVGDTIHLSEHIGD